MDATGLLALLVVIVALDTIAIGALVLLTLRRPRIRLDGWSGRGAGAWSGAALTPPLAADAPAAATGNRADGAALGTAEPDPLADAITAFLGRSDGLFRSGGPAVAPAAPLAAEPTSAAASQAAASQAAASPVTASPVADEPAFRPVPVVALLRPSRYVASGNRPPAPTSPAPDSTPAPATETAPGALDRGPVPVAIDAGPARTPSEGVAVANLPPGPAPQPEPGFPSRPATRLTTALTAIDPELSVVAEAALVAAAARLSPVIAGVLRERSRAGDVVRVVAPGRFSIDLPDTTTIGAGVLGARLRDSCEAWLAAELPPLRLDLAAAALAGGEMGSGTTIARSAGPERRRLSTPGT